MNRKSLAAALAASVALHPLSARVESISIDSREAIPAARPGAPDYVLIRGHYRGSLDPSDTRSVPITDLDGAPRDANGRVGYRATFAIAMPADPARASGFLIYDVPNRGNGAVAADPAGHIHVISGWQGDIAPQPGVQYLEVPVAAGRAGPVLQQFINIPRGSASIAITGGIGRPTPRPVPVTLDTRQAQLAVQRTDDDAPRPIAATDWAFADCSATPFPGTPDGSKLCLRGGFDPDHAYTLVYQGRDPQILGIGFAAVRDLNSFLRYDAAAVDGSANPLAGLVRWTIATGTSQSGNFVKSLIHHGHNADERGRIVFDGANPHIAARQVPLNLRFAVPGGAANPYEVGSEGTLWWGRYDDRRRGRGVSSFLDRCTATATCPRVMETFGSAEFWGLRMSPGLVGTDAVTDIPLPDGVRRYYSPGTTHGGSYRGGWPVNGDPTYPGAPKCALPWNPNPMTDTRRALLVALQNWVAKGIAPPPSAYPMLARGELVEPTSAAMGWPFIQGWPAPDGMLNTLPDQDFGPQFDDRHLSGIARQPPAIRGMIPQRVPRVDADGNEVGGVPSVQHLVPLGTYTGWNRLKSGYGAGGNCGFVGGFIPFARTEAGRIANGDPRPSLEARYGTHDGFVARVRSVAAQQVADGWLLPEDADRIVAEAQASDVLR